jgi:hypothetical protein
VIPAQSIDSFLKFVSELQGVSEKTSSEVLGVSHMLLSLSPDTLEKAHLAFSALVRMISEETKSQIPGLVVRISEIEKSTCERISSLAAQQIGKAPQAKLPAAPAAAAPAAADAPPLSPVEVPHGRRKRPADGLEASEGEKSKKAAVGEERKPVLVDHEKHAEKKTVAAEEVSFNVLSQFAGIPRVSDLYFDHEGRLYVLWTVPGGRGEGDTTIVNIQDVANFANRSNTSKIGIRIKRSDEGVMVFKSIFIDGRETDKAIPEPWKEIVGKAINHLAERLKGPA